MVLNVSHLKLGCFTHFVDFVQISPNLVPIFQSDCFFSAEMSAVLI